MDAFYFCEKSNQRIPSDKESATYKQLGNITGLEPGDMLRGQNGEGKEVKF